VVQVPVVVVPRIEFAICAGGVGFADSAAFAT